jgi:hypothetical protein
MNFIATDVTLIDLLMCTKGGCMCFQSNGWQAVASHRTAKHPGALGGSQRTLSDMARCCCYWLLPLLLLLLLLLLLPPCRSEPLPPFRHRQRRQQL